MPSVSSPAVGRAAFSSDSGHSFNGVWNAGGIPLAAQLLPLFVFLGVYGGDGGPY